MLTTTLCLLREHRVCIGRYNHLKWALGPDWGDHEPVSIMKIMDTNGISDALWALRAVPQEQIGLRDRLARLFAVACVRRTPISGGRTVWDLLSDPLSRKAVEVAEHFAIGEATIEELRAAAYAAYAGAASYGAAAYAAYAAYGAAAYGAAAYAAYAAATCAAAAAAKEKAKITQGTIFREIFGRRES